MAAQVYTVPMASTTIVANATLVIIHAASAMTTGGSLIEILRAWVGQDRHRDLPAIGHHPRAQGRPPSARTPPRLLCLIRWERWHQRITGGTSGAAGTAGTDASAEGAGAVTTIVPDGFNNLNGWLWVPTPEERIIVGPDQAVVLKIVGTPTVLTNWSAGLTYSELA